MARSMTNKIEEQDFYCKLRSILITLQVFRWISVPSSTCKELESCQSVWTASKKLNWLKKSTTLLSSIEEMKTQGKLLCPRLERQTGKYRESWFPGDRNYKHKSLQEPVPVWENLNCSWWIAGGSMWMGLRVKNSRWMKRASNN